MKSEENIRNPDYKSIDLSLLSATDLRSLPSFSRKYEYVHLHRDPRLYKIEEGLDSVVCLWMKSNQQDMVVKFYFHSAMTLELLAHYAECVNFASKSIKIPPLHTEQGSISFSVTPVLSTQTADLAEAPETVISYSPYVKGIELEKASDSTEYLKDVLIDSDLSTMESERLLQFAELWENNPDFKNAILNRIAELNTALQTLFPTANAECDLINLKVSSADDGWSISATDISPNIYQFTTAVTLQ